MLITSLLLCYAIYRAHVVTVTKLFGLIVNARNHAHLREALSCTLSVCAANPSMLHVFTALQLDLTTAVSKIITVSPSPLLYTT